MCSVLLWFGRFFILFMYTLLCVYDRKSRLKECTLLLEWKVMKFLRVLSSCRGLFRSLSPTPKQAQFLTQSRWFHTSALLWLLGCLKGCELMFKFKDQYKNPSLKGVSPSPALESKYKTKTRVIFALSWKNQNPASDILAISNLDVVAKFSLTFFILFTCLSTCSIQYNVD